MNWRQQIALLTPSNPIKFPTKRKPRPCKRTMSWQTWHRKMSQSFGEFYYFCLLGDPRKCDKKTVLEGACHTCTRLAEHMPKHFSLTEDRCEHTGKTCFQVAKKIHVRGYIK